MSLLETQTSRAWTMQGGRRVTFVRSSCFCYTPWSNLDSQVIWLLIFTFLAVLTVQDLVKLPTRNSFETDKKITQVSLTKEFLTWPVDVSTTIDHEDALPFPSVTVCNQNRVSCRRLKEFLKRCQVIWQKILFFIYLSDIWRPGPLSARTRRSWSSWWKKALVTTRSFRAKRKKH